jgi:hypothetical protein
MSNHAIGLEMWSEPKETSLFTMSPSTSSACDHILLFEVTWFASEDPSTISGTNLASTGFIFM